MNAGHAALKSSPSHLALALVATTALVGVAGRLLVTPPGGGGPSAPLPGALAGALIVPPAAVAHNPGDQAVRVGTRLDRAAVLQGDTGLVRMQLTLAGEAAGQLPRVPTDLVVVLDHSGSMAGDKMVFAHAAVRELITQLIPGDRFGMVIYDDDAEEIIPLSELTPGAADRWSRLVETVQPDGATNIGEGLDRALSAARQAQRPGRASRVILLSDGQATAGDTSDEGLKARARRVSEASFSLSAIGVGEDFNEGLMGGLADVGTGNYYYLSSGQGLAEILHKELAASRETVASALTVTLSPGPGVEVLDAGGYPLTSADGRVQFTPGALFGGQAREIWVTYRVQTQGAESRDLGAVQVGWKGIDGAPDATSLAAGPAVVCVSKPAEFMAAIDREVWAEAVAKEELGQVQQQVASAVKAGNREEAYAQLEGYWARNNALNQTLQSAEVERSLQEAQALRAQIQDAFTGEDQAGKQKKLSKSQGLLGYDARRAGAKK